MSLEVRTPTRIPFHALIVSSPVYPRLVEVSSMGQVTCHVPTLTRTAEDARAWRSLLAGQAGLEVRDIVVLGDDLTQPTATPVPVTSGEFLSAFQAMITRAAATGAQPVLVFSGAGLWVDGKGAGLAFADTELTSGGFIGVVWLNDLARLLDAVISSNRLYAWLDCGFRSAANAPTSVRTVTPSAVMPTGAVRFRSSDAVYPVDPQATSDEDTGLGSLTKAWSNEVVNLSEIDPGNLTFRILEIRPVDGETPLGVVVVIDTGASGVPNTFTEGREHWRWNSGTQAWPDTFRLVTLGNAGYPPFATSAGIEAFQHQAFPPNAAVALPTSIAGGPFYQLSKLAGSTPVALDAHFHHLVEGDAVFTRWYAAPAALAGGYLNLQPGESLVFTRLTTPPTGAGLRHYVSAVRQ